MQEQNPKQCPYYTPITPLKKEGGGVVVYKNNVFIINHPEEREAVIYITWSTIFLVLFCLAFVALVGWAVYELVLLVELTCRWIVQHREALAFTVFIVAGVLLVTYYSIKKIQENESDYFV